MPVFINYGGGIRLSSDVTSKVAESVLETIKKELPEEAHCEAVIHRILSEAKDLVNCKKIVL